jgi:hypothetical protein
LRLPASSKFRPPLAHPAAHPLPNDTAVQATTIRRAIADGTEVVSASNIHLDQVELARRWKLSPRTLERWRWLGQPPRFLKIGGRVVYRLEDIEGFEAEQLREITPRSRKPRSRDV